MQKKRKILDDFKFVTPPLSGGIWHCNFIDNPSGKFLLLQIDIFCRDIFNSVNDWINSKTPPEQEKINDDFLVIHDSSHGIQF